MSDRYSRALNDRLERLGSRFIAILDEIDRSECPGCGRSGNVQALREGGNVRMVCETPMPSFDDDMPETCGFQVVALRTTIEDLPRPRFISVEPTPISKPTPRRKPAVKKRAIASNQPKKRTRV